VLSCDAMFLLPPNLHQSILAPARHHVSAGAPVQGVHLVRVPRQGEQGLLRRTSLPHFDRAVLARGTQQTRIRGPAYLVHAAHVPVKRVKEPPVAPVPQLELLVKTCTSKEPAVWAKTQVRYRLHVPRQSRYGLAVVCGVPEVQGEVVRAGHEALKLVLVVAKGLLGATVPLNGALLGGQGSGWLVNQLGLLLFVVLLHDLLFRVKRACAAQEGRGQRQGVDAVRVTRKHPGNLCLVWG
jgi:hypothetical protein